MAEDFNHNAGVCPGIFTLIVSLPFVGVALLVAGYLGYLPFKTEIHTLITLLGIFFIFLFFVRHNASYAACMVSKNFTLMENDLQNALRDNELTIMGKTKSTLTVRDFMKEYFKDIRDDNYARVASVIFPMLGILGTFTAIAISMPDFTVSSSDKLDREITLLLSGIGTAFYASIYGIFLSLWWIFFERRGLAKIEKEIISLEKLYNGRIWKKSELVKHEHMQSELRDYKIVSALEETFSLDFIREMSRKHMDDYRSMLEETLEAIKIVTEKMGEATAGLKETVEMIEEKKSAKESEALMMRNLEMFVHTAKELERGLVHFNNSVDYTFDRIDIELASAVEKLGRVVELIARRELNRRVESDDLHDMRR